MFTQAMPKERWLIPCALPVNLSTNYLQKKYQNAQKEREGFFHLTDIQGSIEETRAQFIIRDHDREAFENRKELLKKIG